tara:strand:+ start:212 stop:529 length:318 start_codon:yes stop_codon:yes gene_type:complete
MDTKIILIVVLVIIVSILVTAMTMTAYFNSIPTENELVEERLREYELIFEDQCYPGDSSITHHGLRWCEEKFTERSDITQVLEDCGYAKIGSKYLTLCDYYRSYR